MAIFSLNHSFIGRTTHAPGSASLYARYITRPEVCTEVVGGWTPTEPRELMTWLDTEEQGDRKNARVIDKVIVALPVELTHEQNVELVQNFCQRMSLGRAHWVAAFHDGPGDADNPHAHIIFRDRDVETDRRVMMTTDKGSTEALRKGWEQEVNIALEQAGLEQRVDRRSLEAQGIDREPQIHVGAGAIELGKKGHEFESAEKEVTRLIDGDIKTVTVNYPVIDEGKTRYEENEERIARNRARAMELTDPDLDWTQRGGMVPQQASAMSWVREAAARSEALYQRAMNGEATADADPMDRALVQTHMSERAQARTGKEPEQEVGDAKALAWEARMSDMARAMQEATEKQVEREPGLELDL